MLDWVVVTNTWSSPKFAHVFLGQKPKFAAHYIHNNQATHLRKPVLARKHQAQSFWGPRERQKIDIQSSKHHVGETGFCQFLGLLFHYKMERSVRENSSLKLRM